MALTHLADTSVLTRLRVEAVRRALRELLGARRVARCSLSDLELGYSARNGEEWDSITSAVAALAERAPQPPDVMRALTVQRLLAVAGLEGRKVPDLLIAAVAERERLILLHYDYDFELIADITGQPHQWVLPRGSVS